MYYLQSRYYDPEIGRFINADGLISTGQGLQGNNMFAYCSNNPVNREDSSGMFWNKIGTFFKKIGNKVKDFVKQTFGAGSSTTVTVRETKVDVLPSISPIAIESGTTTVETIKSRGDSTKPISVYAEGNISSSITSSVGANINVSNLTMNINLAVDDISLSISQQTGSETKGFALKNNPSQLKRGYEIYSELQWDDTTHTSYINVSVNGGVVLLAYAFMVTGLPIHEALKAYA